MLRCGHWRCVCTDGPVFDAGDFQAERAGRRDVLPRSTRSSALSRRLRPRCAISRSSEPTNSTGPMPIRPAMMAIKNRAMVSRESSRSMMKSPSGNRRPAPRPAAAGQRILACISAFCRVPAGPLSRAAASAANSCRLAGGGRRSSPDRRRRARQQIFAVAEVVTVKERLAGGDEPHRVVGCRLLASALLDGHMKNWVCMSFPVSGRGPKIHPRAG